MRSLNVWCPAEKFILGVFGNCCRISMHFPQHVHAVWKFGVVIVANYISSLGLMELTLTYFTGSAPVFALPLVTSLIRWGAESCVCFIGNVWKRAHPLWPCDHLVLPRSGCSNATSCSARAHGESEAVDPAATDGMVAYLVLYVFGVVSSSNKKHYTKKTKPVFSWWSDDQTEPI